MENLIAQEPLTTLEQSVLTALINGLYAEAGFTDVDAHDLTRATGIPTRSIRGILSSLIKKGYIAIEGNNSGYQLIHLLESHYYLHPQWSQEVPQRYWNLNESEQGLTYREIWEKRQTSTL